MNVAEFIQARNGLGSSPAEPVRKKRLRVYVLCGAVALAAGTAIALTWSHLRSAGQAAGMTISDAEARAEAKRTLGAFLAARTAEQRAEFVIGGQQVLPLMQAYYAGREIEPVSAEDFEPVSWNFNKEARNCVALELPRGRNLSTAVACVKRADSGKWLLDWDIWTQSMDGRFRDFINRPAEGEHILRVRLTSSSVSEAGLKLEVSDPFSIGSTLNLDVNRADLTALYMADLPSGTSRTATLQFVWVNDSLTGTLQPVLRRHICWGFQNLDGVEALEREPVRARKHHPPMPPQPAQEPEVDLAVNPEPVVEAAVQTAVLTTSASAPPAKPEPAVTVRRASRK